jgi:RNA polymerase sigma-70 factor (ECF subfamily)
MAISLTGALAQPQAPERQALFEDLVRQFEKPLYQFAYRLCGNPYEAQDLLQEGFFRAYKAFGKFEAGSAFDRWLYQIIHNLYIDHYRKKRNRPLVASIDEPNPNLDSEKALEIPDWSFNPEIEVVRGELGHQIQTALEKIQPEYRAAVVLCDVQGLSYEEIALILDCSIGTVRSRIHRGRKLLRQILLPYLNEMGVDKE